MFGRLGNCEAGGVVFGVGRSIVGISTAMFLRGVVGTTWKTELVRSGVGGEYFNKQVI